MLDAKTNHYLTDTNAGTPMGNLFRRFWIPFLMSSELPAPDCDPVRVRLLGEDLVAFKDTEGKVGLVDAFCPHRRAPLFFGRNEECGLRCVYHGWKYDTAGNCVDMPSEPAESTFKDRIKIKSYPAVDKGGLVWAYMGPPEQKPELPDFEFMGLSDSQKYMARYEIECNYLQAMEGDDDSSHVSHLHSTLGGSVDNYSRGTNMKLVNAWVGDKAPVMQVIDTNYGHITGARRNSAEDTYYWRIYHWIAPFYHLPPQEVGMSMQCNIRIPIDNVNSMFFRIIYQPDRDFTAKELYHFQHMGDDFPETIPGTNKTKANKSNDYLIDRYMQRNYNYTGIKGFPTQDMAVVEAMGPIVDRSQEHLGTSDIAIIKKRMKLKKLAEALEKGVEPRVVLENEFKEMRAIAIELPREMDFIEGAHDYMYSRKR